MAQLKTNLYNRSNIKWNRIDLKVISLRVFTAFSPHDSRVSAIFQYGPNPGFFVLFSVFSNKHQCKFYNKFV